ncbi:MerR family transcriptional regulator [Nocardia sp. NBC_00565]|uniref:MerR family transcriptional regulator n=1 Tax=Nocardia sp. NBC_00565 TaxID=2975993 RepID=UPI002E81ED9B|nr:MerR family transcriptional regulator [Nocardia sp. NBC_00565]WUC07080.1 MerR family transcriptional regulator [Nocardia sp. NBC_00565]
MLIGELAGRTRTSERLLRYYERVGLLAADRRHNGYREYADDAEQRVTQIRALLAAGLSTRVIKQLLPCTRDGGALRACPGVLPALHDRLAELDRRAAELDAARDLLRRTIAETEQSGAAPHRSR